MAHMESTFLLFSELLFECLMSWECKIIHLKVGGKWNT
jgi:hypothetical protein